MKVFVKVRPLTAALCAVNSAIALTAIVYALRGTQATVLLATPAILIAPPPQHLQVPTMHMDIAVVQDADLFHSSRRFFEAPVVAATAPPLPNYELVGTFAIPNKPTLAFLKNPLTGVSRKVVAGESLDGWDIQLVESRRVVLQYQNESREILAAAHDRDPQSGPATVAAATPVSLSPASPAAPVTMAANSGVRMLGTPVTEETRAEQMRRLAQSRLSTPVARPPPSNFPAQSGYVNPGQPVDVRRLYRGPRQ
jgi:hypothetical protein